MAPFRVLSQIFQVKAGIKRQSFVTTSISMAIFLVFVVFYVQQHQKRKQSILSTAMSADNHQVVTVNKDSVASYFSRTSTTATTHAPPNAINRQIDSTPPIPSSYSSVPNSIWEENGNEARFDFPSRSKTDPIDKTVITDRTTSKITNNAQDGFLTETSTSALQQHDLPQDEVASNQDEPVCQFPHQDPFHPSVLQRFSLLKTLTCESGSISLVYRDGNYVHLNTTRTTLNNFNIKHCTLSVLKRKSGKDFVLAISPIPKPFNSSIEIPRGEDHFMTTCFNHRNTSVSRGYFSVIREKASTERRCQTNFQRHVKDHSPKETLSVLFVGVDGVSRQGMIRSMNKTKQFVTDTLQAIELFKFNKVGDNTFPNIVPLLTGLHKDELANKWPSQERMDEVDHLFLWREFQNAGYRTAMVLDRTRITAFHYLKSGWKHPTFDYYNRPMVLKTEADIQSRSKKECCIGQTPEVTFLLDNWLQLTSVFNNTKDRPYFAFSFLNRLTHENANRISMADELYLDFFQTLHARRVLNNTLVVFFSDHGPRFGLARHTFNGILESRTPFVFLIFPQWFKSRYPEVENAMRTNQHRLTTMFDLHETLKDLLQFHGRSVPGNIRSRGISLFNEIPEHRTCVHAGIPIQLCMCSNMTKINPSSNLSREIAKVMMKHIVKLTENIRDKCEELTLLSIEAVASVVDNQKDAKAPVYHVILETSPNKAIYEGVLQRSGSIVGFRSSWILQGFPVRLNLYRGQAECIDSAKLRPFCYCKSDRQKKK